MALTDDDVREILRLIDESDVAELRVETVVPAERLETVVAALRGAHPYEEPAYDVYPLLDA